MEREKRGGVGIVLFFFFFQAEDGIRDSPVTGVQTCALPIFQFSRVLSSFYLFDWLPCLNVTLVPKTIIFPTANLTTYFWSNISQIGRASCRERV